MVASEETLSQRRKSRMDGGRRKEGIEGKEREKRRGCYEKKQ